jgi:hypothetical protein
MVEAADTRAEEQSGEDVFSFLPRFSAFQPRTRNEAALPEAATADTTTRQRRPGGPDAQQAIESFTTELRIMIEQCAHYQAAQVDAARTSAPSLVHTTAATAIGASAPPPMWRDEPGALISRLRQDIEEIAHDDEEDDN